MERISFLAIFITSLFLLNMTYCVEDEVKRTLINFLAQLSGNTLQQNSTLAWKFESDPCKDFWEGVNCDGHNTSVKKLYLDRFNLNGTFDASMLCNLQPLALSLTILSLNGNNISGGIAAEIGNCKQLTGLYISGNQLSGNLPSSLATLNNLKWLDVSNNKFSGLLPNLSRISGLNVFLAQNNELSGEIPLFDFSNFDQFNVSNNNFSSLIPDVHGHFFADSFLGNPGLCGDPLPKNCSDVPLNVDEKPQESKGAKGPSNEQILMYSGYAALGSMLILFVVLRLCVRKKKETKIEAVNEAVANDDVMDKHSNFSGEYKSGVSRSECSAASESGMASQSLIVLSRPVVNELRLEDLLRAPAELIGTGKYGSLYKVMLDNGIMVVVKRIKDWSISSHDFKQRMQMLSQVKHPHMLSPLAFYCSQQEKLLVYEYQQNGSLFKLLHGNSKAFDWTSRLGIAATIADVLGFMHQELGKHRIVHGNMKSSNILLNNNMEPCISEYGVMVMDDQQISPFATPIDSAGASSILKGDVYGFGVVLLELLTGKLVKNNGIDLTDWVQSVVREEWTGEVFDKALISEYGSEERMVNLLQVAIKCVNRSPEARPSMNQVALMISTIKEEEEKSLIYGV